MSRGDPVLDTHVPAVPSAPWAQAGDWQCVGPPGGLCRVCLRNVVMRILPPPSLYPPRQKPFLAVGTAVVGQVLAVMKRLEDVRGAGGSELMSGGGDHPQSLGQGCRREERRGGLGPKSTYTQNGPTGVSRPHFHPRTAPPRIGGLGVGVSTFLPKSIAGRPGPDLWIHRIPPLRPPAGGTYV